MTQRDDVFLLYHPLTRKTGQRLHSYLGCDGGEDPVNGTYDYLIRWGSRRRPTGRTFRPEEVVNSPRAIRNATQKFDALNSLSLAGIPTPAFTRDKDRIGPPGSDAALTYPVLGRDKSHSAGSDIDLIMQERDIELSGQSHHYVQYEPVATEFRVQVFNGDVLKVHEKLLRTEADNDDPHIRNSENGWVFANPRSERPDTDIAIDAVDALDLEFGAVDLIRVEGTGEELVLEVNTAPTLDEANMERYGQAIQDYTGIVGVPGIDAVDFSDD